MEVSKKKKKKVGEGGGGRKKKELVTVAGSTMCPGWRNAVRLIRPSVSRTNSAEAEMEMRKRERAAGGGPGDLVGTLQVRGAKDTKRTEEKYLVCRTPTGFSQEWSERRPTGGIQERLTQQVGRGGGVREKASTWRTGRVKEEVMRPESKKRSSSSIDPINLEFQNPAWTAQTPSADFA